MYLDSFMDKNELPQLCSLVAVPALCDLLELRLSRNNTPHPSTSKKAKEKETAANKRSKQPKQALGAALPA